MKLKRTIKTILIRLKIIHSANLSNKGERIDIFKNTKNWQDLDPVKKTHLKRYEFAQTLVNINDICADMACGTGYGSVILSSKAKAVYGVDLDSRVINEITKRYKNNSNVFFECQNLLNIDYKNKFDKIISYETIEHLDEKDIVTALTKFNRALVDNGILIFSTPYLQLKSDKAIKMGFHRTFDIDENKIKGWLYETHFELCYFKYQNYSSCIVADDLEWKDFIICVATKQL